MIALVVTALAAPALESGNTAHTLAQADGKLSFGVFRPWSIRIDERTDLITTGLLGSFLAPRVDLKRQLHAPTDELPVTLSLLVGADSPTPIANLSRGWLYGKEDRLPFALQVKAGLLVSRQWGRVRLTTGATLRAGFSTGPNDYTPRDFFFIDWVLAPLVEGPVALRLKLQGDWSATEALLFTGEIHGQLTQESFEIATRWFAAWGITDHLALGVGVATHLDRRPNGYRHYIAPLADLQFRY